MSLYEVLVVAALVGVGGFAYRLYRKDTSQDPEVQAKQAAASQTDVRARPQQAGRQRLTVSACRPAGVTFHSRRRSSRSRLDPVPHVPLGIEDVDGHLGAARPGVPELVGVEAARAGMADVVQLLAEMEEEDHRQDVPAHRIDRMHAGGEGRDQKLAARAGVVVRDHVRGIVRRPEGGVERRRIARERIAVPLVEVPQRLAEGVLRQLAQGVVARHERGVGVRALIGPDPHVRIEARRRAAEHAVEILAPHVGRGPGEMARRRLDEVGEIVGLDIEGAGIVEHARELAVVERRRRPAP